jgi:hypothetical protein
MTKLPIRTLIAVTMALGMSGVAWAQDDTQGKKCKPSTLRGSYIFTASGFNIVGGVSQPKTIVELIDFHGDGTVSVPGGTLSINGVVTQIPPTGVGEYTLETDCTGSLAFVSGPSFNIFIVPDGKNGWMIQTNPNTVFQGTLTLLHR